MISSPPRSSPRPRCSSTVIRSHRRSFAHWSTAHRIIHCRPSYSFDELRVLTFCLRVTATHIRHYLYHRHLLSLFIATTANDDVFYLLCHSSICSACGIGDRHSIKSSFGAYRHRPGSPSSLRWSCGVYLEVCLLFVLTIFTTDLWQSRAHSWSSRRYYRLSLPPKHKERVHDTALLGTPHALFLLIVIQCVSLLISPRPNNQPIHIHIYPTHKLDGNLCWYVFKDQPRPRRRRHACSCVSRFVVARNHSRNSHTVYLPRPQRPSPLAGDGGTVRLTTGCGRSKSLLTFGGWY